MGKSGYFFCRNNGQSMLEYLVVSGIIVVAVLAFVARTVPGKTTQSMQTFLDKVRF